MKVRFAYNVYIDTDHVPEDFDDIIKKSFELYTKGTSKDYIYQDKLRYIDMMRKHLHKADIAKECVMEIMKDRMECCVMEEGEIPDKEDYLSVEFMEECFNNGRTNLCDHYTGDHHIDDVIMQLLVRAIKVVINY